MPRNSKGQFVLIWWIQNSSRSVIKTSLLPKNRRKKNDIVSLPWKDSDGKITNYQAKIIEFADDEQDLWTIRMNDLGEVCDNNAKLFPQEVINKEKELKQTNKSRKTLASKAKSNLEIELRKETSLYDINKSYEQQPQHDVPSGKKNKETSKQKGKSKKRDKDNKNNAHTVQEQINSSAKIDHAVTVETEKKSLPHEAHPFSISSLLKKPNDILITSEPSTKLAPFPPAYHLDLFNESYNHHHTNTTVNIDDFSSVSLFEGGMISPKNANPMMNTITALPSSSTSLLEIGATSQENANQILNPTNVISFSSVSLSETENNQSSIIPLNSELTYNSQFHEPFNSSTVKNFVPCTTATLTTSRNEAVIFSEPSINLNPRTSCEGINNCNQRIECFTENNSVLLSNSNLTNNIDLDNAINREDEDSTDTEVEEDIGALHAFIPHEVTDHDVNFMRMIEASLEMAYQSQQKNNPNLECMTNLLENFSKAGENKGKISAKYEVYFPLTEIMKIEKESEIEPGISDWKNLVKLALLYVYGEGLYFYTAKGRLSSRPGLNKNIQKAILDWARSRSKKVIKKEIYTKYVNKMIENRRGTETKWTPNEITESGLQFFRNVIKVIEKANERYRKSLSPSHQSEKLPEEFSIANLQTHTKISANHEIYLPSDTAAYIIKKSRTQSSLDWKYAVKLTLMEIYGKKLKNYCALGKVGDRPRIDPELFEALYEWLNAYFSEDDQIKKSDYIKYINKLSGNLRKKKKDNAKKVKSTKNKE